MIRRPPRSTLDRSSAASDVYKRQGQGFKGSRKSTPFAAQVASEVAGRAAIEQGIKNVCLLYTSPSPRDRTRSRMPSSA